MVKASVSLKNKRRLSIEKTVVENNKKATTKKVLKEEKKKKEEKKEELQQKVYTSTEKHTKTPISQRALKYVRQFLESTLSKDCLDFLYSLKLDFVYEDSFLKTNYNSESVCKFLYILQNIGVAEYIKQERTNEKARFDFLWVIRSDEILRKARIFYEKQLQRLDELLKIMESQYLYFDPTKEKYYTFDEAIERDFMGENGDELKVCDADILLKKKHKYEKIIKSLTNVQLTSLKKI